jgi:ATP-dependent protease HslVU (ClpYQ) peptidase subunit
MTTIVGVEYDDHCVVAADSITVGGNGRRYIHPSMTKIAERGAFLIAGAGDAQPCDALQHTWNPPRVLQKDKQDLFNFMVSKVVPSMRECIKNSGYDPDKDDKEAGFDFLIAVGGQLFEVDTQFSVAKSKDRIYGVGSGAAFAMGALAAGATLEWAVEIAENFSVNTEGPILVKKQFK